MAGMCIGSASLRSRKQCPRRSTGNRSGRHRRLRRQCYLRPRFAAGTPLLGGRLASLRYPAGGRPCRSHSRNRGLRRDQRRPDRTVKTYRHSTGQRAPLQRHPAAEARRRPCTRNVVLHKGAFIRPAMIPVSSARHCWHMATFEMTRSNSYAQPRSWMARVTTPPSFLPTCQRKSDAHSEGGVPCESSFPR